jgi:hypothetical protein
VTTKPKLLSGGNSQMAMCYGDASVQAYIAAMPGWKSDVGRRLDALIVRNVPKRAQGRKVEHALLWHRGPRLVPGVPRLRPLRQGDLFPRHVAATYSIR